MENKTFSEEYDEIRDLLAVGLAEFYTIHNGEKSMFSFDTIFDAVSVQIKQLDKLFTRILARQSD